MLNDRPPFTHSRTLYYTLLPSIYCFPTPWWARTQVQVLLFDRQLFKHWSSIPFLLTAKCLFLWLYILSLALLSADNGCCCLGITFSVCLFIDQWMKLIIKMIKILIVKEEIRCRDVDVTSWQKHTETNCYCTVDRTPLLCLMLCSYMSITHKC